MIFRNAQMYISIHITIDIPSFKKKVNVRTQSDEPADSKNFVLAKSGNLREVDDELT